MGRSRGNFHAYEDTIGRTRKKKNAVNVEASESTSAGQGTAGGKYNCDYCLKDITGRIRMKCAACPDFDLCVECMSVGAEVQPHKNDHPYRIMGSLTFSLFSHDWTADDEMLLLEGIEIYGLGNWAEVAEHVGTKNKEQCIEHYKNVYLNSPHFPLPDMSKIKGKNIKELQAMAKANSEDKKGEINMKDEYCFPPRVKVEEMNKVDSQSNRTCGGKKPAFSAKNGPSLVETSGYNPKREEFDPEYDNDAEQLLAEMEFKETDTEEERELKLRVLCIYSKRLDERKRRKQFILERNLLYPSAFEKDLSPEERRLCRRYDVFMRFHSKEEHQELLETVVAENRFLKKLQGFKEAQAAGCRTSAEAELYLLKRRKREAEENSRRVKQNGQFGPNEQGGLNAVMASEPVGKDASSRPAGQTSAGYINDLDLIGFPETQLLSESEKRLCSEIKLVPPMYFQMQQVMSEEIFKGKITKKSDAHHLFKIEASKIDKVYDVLVKKGIAQP